MRILQAGALGLLFLLARPAVLQDDGEACAKFNRCHSSHDKEKIKCSKCDRNQIPANDSMCSSCANKEKVCAHCGKPKPGSAPARKTKCRTIDEAVANIKAEDLRKLLTHVASDEMKGRLAGSPEHTKLTDEYAEIYKKAGLKPAAGGSFIQPCDVRGRPSRNVCALLEGEKAEVIIYGGHSDHVGIAGSGPPGQQKGGAKGGDNIFNGADDNGSGSVTVLTIARVLGESGLKPKRSILFMNWTGEEWGLIGSKHNARNPCVPKESILAVINTDMLSRYSNKNTVYIGGLGTEQGDDWEGIVKRSCDKAGIQCQLSQPSRISGGDSDHSSYRDVGIPGMYWWTGMHADYHTVTDNPDKCDYAGMEKVARAVALTLWEMANSDKRWSFQNQ
jgi:hypothetical protein